MRITLRQEIQRYLRTGDHDHDCKARLLEELKRGPMPPRKQVAAKEYIDILREAVNSRNGWKRILNRCAPPPRPSREFVASLMRDMKLSGKCSPHEADPAEDRA